LSWTIISQAKATEFSILTGTISHIRDGDTIEVGGIPIRIAALNCPENDTLEGQFASIFALQFEGSKVTCDLTGAMSYQRLVGYCRIGKTDFATALIENTNCKIWPKYDVWQRYSK
jgi:endonuclease YncB( thermonuclease family)